MADRPKEVALIARQVHTLTPCDGAHGLMRTLQRWALPLALMLAAPIAIARPDPLVLRQGLDATEVWPRIEVYVDATQQMAVGAIAALPESVWSPIPRRHHHWSAGGDRAMWARLVLRNSDHPAEKWMLVHEQTFVDRVQVFTKDGSAWREITGTREAHREWMGGTHNPAFQLHLPSGTSSALLVRTDTLSHLRFPLHVYEEQLYFRETRGDYLVRGMIGVIPLVATFFMLLLWLVTRDRSLLVFIGMIASEVVGAAWVGGMLHVTLPWMGSEALGLVGFCALLIGIGCGLTHARLFLSLDATMPQLATLFRILVWLLPLTLIPELMGHGIGRNSAIIAWFVCTQLLFGVSVIRALQGQPFAGTYALAWGTYLASATLIVINMAGLIPPNLSNMTLFAQGSIVSLVFCYATVGQVRARELSTQATLLKERTSLEMSKTRTQLFAATNHDMRQPVQSLGLFIELLRTRTPATDVDSIVRRLRSAYLSLSDFLDGLMSVVQLEAGTLKPQWSHFPLQDLLDPLVDEYREQARAKHLALRCVPTSVWVRSDRVLLERILRNLLANAVRYTESGRLLIGVRRRRGSVSIQILDTGVGFTIAAKARAFDEFTRFADGSDGVGLGLSNVRGLCRLLGHGVKLVSTVGRGSCFSITLEDSTMKTRRMAA